MKNKKKIKVLVVDDSFFMRKIIADVLEICDEIEVVGEAKNGEIAIEKNHALRPDVITMDYNMPGINGAETVREIMKDKSFQPSIIMFSALTSRGADETLECLSYGAIDFVAKPSGDELSLNLKGVQLEIIEKIKIAAAAAVGNDCSVEYEQEDIQKEVLKRTKEKTVVDFVVIGASTGGPPAVEKILVNLPDRFNSTILIIQHMPKLFTKSLALRLNKLTPFEVVEISDGDQVKAGVCYVAPGDFHVKIENKNGEKVFKLNQEEIRNGFRPSISVSLESVAAQYGDKTLGIILTGMGHDGADGMLEMREKGGLTIAQSLDTTVVKSMPEAAIKKNAIDEIVPLDKIASRIGEVIS